MEMEKKSGEVMHLLEQSTKEQKSTPASHKHTTNAVAKGGGALGHHHSTPKSKAPSSSSHRPHSSGSKKLKQATLGMSSAAVASVACAPQKGAAVEIQTLSRDSLSHPPSAIKTASSEVGPSTPVSRGSQLNTSDSVEEMDTSNEFEGGEGHAPPSASEGCEEDVVHCVCGSIEDEGFMIQVSYS